MSETHPRAMACLVCAIVLVLAAPASAYKMIVVTSTSISFPGDGPGPGDTISYDIYLDTEGESGITLLSFSRTYDPTLLAYQPGLSDANDYYPLYDPGAGKTQPPTWLEPYFDPPATWSGSLPAIGGQVNVDFLEVNLNETVATATHLYLATLTFVVINAGPVFAGEFSFDHEGNIFLAHGVDVKDSVEWVFVPEPTTALLLGLGLAGLGWRAARARR